jgi:hypothetical protein
VEATVVEMSTEGRSLQHPETTVYTGFFMNLSILHRQYATCQKELKEACNKTSNEAYTIKEWHRLAEKETNRGPGYVKRALEDVKSALEYVNRGEDLDL